MSEFEQERVKQEMDAFLERLRPAEHIRSQLDFDYTINGQSIELLEIRPSWSDASIINRRPFAKATFVKSVNHWKVYWKRASGKWVTYEPQPIAKNVEAFAEMVHADAHCCFFG